MSRRRADRSSSPPITELGFAPSSSSKAAVRRDIGKAYDLIEQYQDTRDIADVEEALKQCDSTLEVQSIDSRACRAYCDMVIGLASSSTAASRGLGSAKMAFDYVLKLKRGNEPFLGKWYHWSSEVRKEFFLRGRLSTDLEVAIDHATKAATIDRGCLHEWQNQRLIAELYLMQYDDNQAKFQHGHIAEDHYRRRQQEALDQANDRSLWALELVDAAAEQDLAFCCWTYGRLLFRKHATDEKLDGLREAIDMLKVAETIDRPSDQAKVLVDLGDAYAAFHQHTHDPEDEDAAATAYMKAEEIKCALERADNANVTADEGDTGSRTLSRPSSPRSESSLPQ